MRKWLATLGFVLLLAGCASLRRNVAGSAFADQDPLSANWLGGTSTLTAERIAAVLALGKSDPVVQGLLREATERLGGGTFEGLAARVSLCADPEVAEGGLTRTEFNDVSVVRTVEEIAFGPRPESTERQLAAVQAGSFLDVRVVTLPDFIRVERTMLPDICISDRVSVLQAYEAIVHELVHALRADPRSQIALARTVTDEGAFRTATVLARGGEVEAYVTGMSARLRLHRSESLTSPIVNLFDPQSGELGAPPIALAARILADRPQGLGYASGLLRDSYPNARRSARAGLSSLYTLAVEALRDRQSHIDTAMANIVIHTNNIAAHRHNIQVASSRGNAALRAQELAALVVSEESLARTKTILEAAGSSKARLAEELTSVGGQLTALRSDPRD